MKFVDQAKITVTAGKGGDGVIAWRKEKYVPKGGPTGGNGGPGGNVIFQADPQLSTLLDFRYNRKYEAQNGNPGEADNCTGRTGVDLIIKVPVGTLIKNAESEAILADLVKPFDQAIIAKGGRGGLGNNFFKSATNQAPRQRTVGKPGETFELELELKLLADVALVGFPNAGKSTLISRISAAKPKIADYPFTTLIPNLGIVQAPEEHRSFVVADIPGLIEGASEGKGLGLQFLRHIERSSILLFLLDGADSLQHPEKAYEILKKELKAFSKELMKKPRLVAITKSDAFTPKDLREFSTMTFDRKKPLIISAVTGENIPDLVSRLWTMVKKEKE
ncbi:MAG: GTPase ObgE [Bacteroidota bacterium]|nr:GTPase ObgE [Bacteroidota bacterium]MDP4230106.1 GTPase ObgE [Bacteroidota bacterium]MDP4236753.1 GTPase ObgE [Bacteroidota bacterium]